MKLATLKDGTRDGRLVVVSRDLARATDATDWLPGSSMRSSGGTLSKARSASGSRRSSRVRSRARRSIPAPPMRRSPGPPSGSTARCSRTTAG